jgi:Single-strand binding protein family
MSCPSWTGWPPSVVRWPGSAAALTRRAPRIQSLSRPPAIRAGQSIVGCLRRRSCHFPVAWGHAGATAGQSRQPHDRAGRRRPGTSVERVQAVAERCVGLRVEVAVAIQGEAHRGMPGPGDLSRGQEPHPLTLDLGQRHPPTRRLRQHAGIHGRAHGLADWWSSPTTPPASHGIAPAPTLEQSSVSFAGIAHPQQREIAKLAAESLSKGSRVVVVDRLQQRSWTAEDGSARSTVEVVADELGPSLGWATATRTTRSSDR